MFGIERSRMGKRQAGFKPDEPELDMVNPTQGTATQVQAAKKFPIAIPISHGTLRSRGWAPKAEKKEKLLPRISGP